MSNTKVIISVKKSENFSQWYHDVVFETGLLGKYDISGCYVYLPESYGMWEKIQDIFNKKFKEIGIKNVYFPTLITETNLNRESSHIEGFTPEVVWASRSEDSDTNKDGIKLAIRPTSECAIYPTFANIIKSHADLPLMWNQWCSVMRWEFSSPTPFIRSREFLWQEGHSGYETYEEADNGALQMLEIYRSMYESILCVPVIKGKKITSEKFAGAKETYTIETYIPEAGRAIQCATSHNLGQNFSKMFDIRFLKKDGGSDYIYQTSWGFTTRSIGVTIMTNGDDTGLIIPNDISNYQIVIVPIYTVSNKISIIEYCKNIIENIKIGRVHLDISDAKPGWKFYYWESKGVPIRIEIGKKDIENSTVKFVRRDTREKYDVKIDNIQNEILKTIELINMNMYKKSMENIIKSMIIYDSKKKLNEYLEGVDTNIGLNVLTICDNDKCKENIKDICKKKDMGKILCEVFNEGKLGEYIYKIMENIIEKDCVVCQNKDKISLFLMAKTF
jgi:prolyl-tRNA synthetase